MTSSTSLTDWRRTSRPTDQDSWVHVVGRTSSFQFRGRADDVRRVGAALGAAYVVEGSVRRAGDQIRVTAQLISARDGMHRWSDTYSGTLKDVFQLQDSIAADLARLWNSTVSSDNTPRETQSPKLMSSFFRGLRRWIVLLRRGRIEPSRY